MMRACWEACSSPVPGAARLLAVHAAVFLGAEGLASAPSLLERVFGKREARIKPRPLSPHFRRSQQDCQAFECHLCPFFCPPPLICHTQYMIICHTQYMSPCTCGEDARKETDVGGHLPRWTCDDPSGRHDVLLSVNSADQGSRPCSAVRRSFFVALGCRGCQ